VNQSLTATALTEDSSTDIQDDFRMLVIGEVCGKKLLYDECKTIAHGLGFEICIRGFSFKCSRSSRCSDGPKQKQKLEFVPESKRRKPSSKQCGCQWTIRFQPHSRMSDESLPPFVKADDTLVRITSLSLLHTNGCLPSLAQLTVTKKRSGTATRSIQMRRMRNCCRIFCESGHIPYRHVRNQLKGLFPDTWIMDTKTITNFLVKCRLHKKEILEGCAFTIDENEPGWMKVVGADNSDHISRATRIAADLLQESMSKSSRVTEVQEYLNSLKTHDKGFDFRISTSPNGTFQGVVWVTSHMRWNYEVCGFCLFLDAMKRKQNYLNWPYLSVVVLNGYKKIGNACEAVCSIERQEAYRCVTF
jgi:hypothetical protein